MAIEITSQFNNKAGKPLDVNSVKSTISERDAIPTGERYLGIKVFVTETKTEYTLLSGITNTDWEALNNTNKYTYETTFTSTTYVQVRHNMNKYPSVVVMDTSNRQIVTQVTYIDRNTVDVSWTGEMSGKVVCN